VPSLWRRRRSRKRTKRKNSGGTLAAATLGGCDDVTGQRSPRLFGIFLRRVHSQSVAAMVGVARLVNGLPPDRHGTEIPVKESREIRYFLRLVETYFHGRRFRPRWALSE
jgi:hypothetical protein